jgi:hypothetical protein
MRRVVVLAEAAEDLEEARKFYDARETGLGDYCVTSLLADIDSLALYHGIHLRQQDCFRMLGSRFPSASTILRQSTRREWWAVLDLRQEPSWIRKQVTQRQ